MRKFLSYFFGTNSDSDRTESKLAMDMQVASASLDIEMAITAHENWKLRLESYLHGTSQESFSPEVMCFDDKCDLGKWIHSKGRKHLGSYCGFNALVNNHKLFHCAASNVISLVQMGKKSQAEKMLTMQVENFSNRMVNDLCDMLVVFIHHRMKTSSEMTAA